MDLSIATVGTPITYTYDTNWTDKLISYGGESIVYDAIGNPTSYRGATLTWNGRLLTSYEKGTDRFEYTYDENGLRTTKKHYDNGVYNLTYHYLWQNSRLYGAKVTFADDRESLVLNYLYDGDEVIGVYLNDKILLYIKNLQGDIISVVNTENNEIVLNYYYDAWGNVSYESSDSIAGAIVSALVLAATNFSYRGYFCDYETGLYYLQSRYYDPEVGRFINLDDTEVTRNASYKFLNANLFAYCYNNPISYIDFLGTISLQYGQYVNYSGYAFGEKFVAFICQKSSNPAKQQYFVNFYYKGYHITSEYDVDFDTLKFDNLQKNAYMFFTKEGSYTLATILFILVKMINVNALYKRTVKGISYELICHYLWSRFKILPDHSNRSDCGGIGYDKNAPAFEKRKELEDDLNYYVKNYMASRALSYTYVTLFEVFLTTRKNG